MAEVEVIPHQQDEGVIASKFVRTPNCVAVSPGRLLLDQSKSIRMLSRRVEKSITGPWVDHDGCGIDPGGK